MAWTHASSKIVLAKTYDVKVGTWRIPLNQISVHKGTQRNRDMKKSPIADISKCNCNSPQWCVTRVCKWGEVLNFPTCPTFKYRIRSSQNIVRKISNLVSIAPFQYEGKEKEVVKLLLGQGWKVFPNTAMLVIRLLSGLSMSWQYEWILSSK